MVIRPLVINMPQITWLICCNTVGETTGAGAEPLPGPLAIGNALVADSEKARAILATLLQDVPVLQPQN